MVSGPTPLDRAAPSWLPSAAKAEWKSILADLRDMGISPRDRMALSIVAAHYASWRKCIAEVFESESDDALCGPHALEARKQAELLKGYLTEFGCTPTSRLRLALGSKTREASKHAEIMARKRLIEQSTN